MTHTVVYYKVARDNTGIHEEIPVILTEFGPLHPLIHYILKHRHMLSESNTTKLVQAVGLLIDYMEANHAAFADAINPFSLALKQAVEAGAYNLTTPQGLVAINSEVTRQAATLAYLQDFRLMMFIALAALPLILLLRAPAKQASSIEEVPAAMD